MIRVFDLRRGRTPRAEAAAEAEEFCNRWKKDVFTFCRMLLGDGVAAEAMSSETLAAYYWSRGRRIDQPSEALPRMLNLAIRASQKDRDGGFEASHSASRLEQAIQRLPPMERVVLIMRNLMHLDWAVVALGTDLSRIEARKIWARAFFQLNELLQRDFPKESD